VTDLPRPSRILDVAVDTIFRTALVFAMFMLFRGHNAPGGGFIAGLVVGVAFVLLFVAGGRPAVEKVMPIAPPVLLGAGLLTAALTGLVLRPAGGAYLEALKFEHDVPLLGTVKATSALPFDIGVFLVVLGLTLVILRMLGGEPSR
jgi:multicomponent Na+:H+ antiporter subunit A